MTDISADDGLDVILIDGGVLITDSIAVCALFIGGHDTALIQEADL